MALTQKRFVFERNGHDKKFFQSWGLPPVPFYDRGDIEISGVLRETRAPGFFHSHVATTPTEFTEPYVVRHQTLVIPVHPGLRDFQDIFSTKKSYIQVYHDRITRAAHQKMTTIRIIFERKN